MTRRRWIASLVLIAATIAAGALTWLLATNQGARWFLGHSSAFLPATVSADRVTGRLAGDLKFEGVRIGHADREIRIGEGQISWHPLELLFGHLAFGTVGLKQVTWEEKRPDLKPLDLTWPLVPKVLERLWGGVDLLRIDGFTYQEPGKAPVVVDRLQTRLGWFFGTATLSGLDLLSREGRMSGSVGIGFGRPGLEGDVVWTPNRAIAGYDRLSLSLKPLPASSPEQVAGRVNLAVYAGKERRFTASGRVGVKPDRITFRELAVQTEGMAGSVTVDAEMIVSRPQIFAEVRLRAEGLQMAGDVKGSSLSGAASVQGTLERYEGQFDLRHSASRPLWLTGRLQGKIAGNGQGLKVREASGALLGGVLTGDLEWTWAANPRLSCRVQGEKLDPARISPDWPGRVNVRAAGAWTWEAGGSTRGAATARFVDSVLRGRSLDGSAEARWEEGGLDLSAAEVRGKGFQLSLKGKPAERLDYTVRAADLSGLVPGSSGRFNGAGWVSRKNGRWAGTLSARGASLLYAGCSIGAVEADARLSDSGTDRITAKVNASHLAYRSWRADRGQLSVEGKTAQHDARLQLTGPAGEILLSLKGGYGKSVWQGRIVEGVMQDRQAGALRLERSAALLIAADRLRIGALSFAGPGEEALFVDGDLRLRPLRGTLKADWRKLNLGRVKAFFGSGSLTGRMTGALDASWADNGRLRFSGSNAGGFAWSAEGLSLICTRQTSPGRG